MGGLDSNTRNVGVSTISMAGQINLHYSTAAGEQSSNNQSYASSAYTPSHLGYVASVKIHFHCKPFFTN